MNQKHPVALVILDGWGIAGETCDNAIAQAKPVIFNFLWNHYPHAQLRASGTAVGLPDGTPGNSEVGHATIGAGAVIQQPLLLINDAIADGSFFKNPALQDVLATCKRKNGRLHLLGLISDGNVHSNEEHLFALMQAAAEFCIPHVFVHAFLDGRDTPPRSAARYLEKLDAACTKYGGEIGSISGRFYAMDRDENWERTRAVYDMLLSKNVATESWQEALNRAYAADVTDEFVQPLLLSSDARVEDDDTLIFFNIRPDRVRQLVALFLNIALPSKKNKPAYASDALPRNLTVASMVCYSEFFGNPFFFAKLEPQETLLDLLEEAGASIFTIAETEKYAHVTYFFSGGSDVQRAHEQRVLIPSSPQVSYDTLPKMSAAAITQAVKASLEQDSADFYLINYANADMVGHSGNLQSTIRAITCLDHQLAVLYQEFVELRGGTLYVTADHGNAEQMWDVDNDMPHTAHTRNDVPFIMVKKELFDTQKTLPLRGLSDIAGFILHQR